MTLALSPRPSEEAGPNAPPSEQDWLSAWRGVATDNVTKGGGDSESRGRGRPRPGMLSRQYWLGRVDVAQARCEVGTPPSLGLRGPSATSREKMKVSRGRGLVCGRGLGRGGAAPRVSRRRRRREVSGGAGVAGRSRASSSPDASLCDPGPPGSLSEPALSAGELDPARNASGAHHWAARAPGRWREGWMHGCTDAWMHGRCKETRPRGAGCNRSGFALHPLQSRLDSKEAPRPRPASWRNWAPTRACPAPLAPGPGGRAWAWPGAEHNRRVQLFTLQQDGGTRRRCS